MESMSDTDEEEKIVLEPESETATPIATKKRRRSKSKRSATRHGSGSTQVHQCDVCQKRFRDSMRLSRHTIVHTSERPYPCKVCKRGFRSTNNLQQHMLLHSGEKRYSCHFCGKRFAQHPGLSGHLRTHRKKFPCDKCDKGFHKKQALEKHIRSHDANRKHSCPYCELRYESHRKLMDHVKRHEEQPEGMQILKVRKKPKAKRKKPSHKSYPMPNDEEDSDATVIISPPSSPGTSGLDRHKYCGLQDKVTPVFDGCSLLCSGDSQETSLEEGEANTEFAIHGNWTFGVEALNHKSDAEHFLLVKDALLTALSETTATIQQMIESTRGLADWLSENKKDAIPSTGLEVGTGSLDCGRKYPVLGHGSLAEVKIGLWGGSPVAVKTYKGVQVLEGLLSEVVLCRHPNVTAVYGLTEDHQGIVMELTEGNISELITGFAQAGGALSLREKVDLARGCLQGLNYLHRMRVLHGSIRPSNVMVDALMVAKLTDVQETALLSLFGSGKVECLQYVAPELKVTPLCPTEKGDIFSLGQTFLDLFSAVCGDRAERIEGVPHPWLKVLCRQMTDPYPATRLPLVHCLAMMATVSTSKEYRACPPKRTLGRIIKPKKSSTSQ